MILRSKQEGFFKTLQGLQVFSLVSTEGTHGDPEGIGLRKSPETLFQKPAGLIEYPHLSQGPAHPVVFYLFAALPGKRGVEGQSLFVIAPVEEFPAKVGLQIIYRVLESLSEEIGRASCRERV